VESQGLGSGFTGAYAHRLLQIKDEDLAIAELTCLGRASNGLDGARFILIRDCDLDLELG
jgi:hypothetical protein